MKRIIAAILFAAAAASVHATDDLCASIGKLAGEIAKSRELGVPEQRTLEGVMGSSEDIKFVRFTALVADDVYHPGEGVDASPASVRAGYESFCRKNGWDK
jgi:hypothetical protein